MKSYNLDQTLLEKISARVGLATTEFALHRQNYVSLAGDMKEVSLKKKAEKEIYVLEYYLLELEKKHNDSSEESKKIQAAKNQIYQLLPNLYKVAGAKDYTTNPTPDDLKRHQESHRDNRLIDATINGDIDLFNAALAAGADVNFEYIFNRPLLLAVKKKNYPMAERLIECKADVNTTAGLKSTDTPLSAAVSNNDFAMARILIKAGAKVDRYSLSKACYAGVSPELFEFLCTQPNVDLNQTVPHGEHTCSRLLPRALRFIDDKDEKADTRKVAVLLRLGPAKSAEEKDYDRNRKLDFYAAINAGKQCVQLFLDAKYECDGDILSRAIESSSTGVIDLLTQNCNEQVVAEARKNLKQHSAYTDLMFDTVTGNLAQVYLMTLVYARDAKNSDKNKAFMNKALLLAAKHNRVDIAKALIQAGANVNCTNELNETPLMEAAKYGHQALVQLLLDNKADANIASQNMGVTALSIATHEQHVGVVQLLLDATNAHTLVNVVNHSGNVSRPALSMGLESKNEGIQNAYKQKVKKLMISDLEKELTKQIEHFEKNSQTLFSINNMKKANKIKGALDRALQDTSQFDDPAKLLTYRKQGQESILDALSWHRIGFFGRPVSRQQVDEFCSTYKLGR